MEFKLGELFSGPGGLGLGAKQATVQFQSQTFTIKHQWAVDYDPDSCSTYIKNICPESPQSVLCQDVRNLNLTSLPRIDALAFGFPCNDFSIVGKKVGFAGEFGPLYTYGVKVLELFQPLWFLAENVEGLSSSHQGQALSVILDELCAAGYNLTVNLYRFEEYGIPQARHRIVIVGIRSDLDFFFEVPKANKKNISCQEALENPPITHNIANHEFTRQSHQVIERLKYIKPGENAWTAQLPSHLKLNVRGAKLSHIYKRLDPCKPAYTVTGSGGGGTHVYHWHEHRALTNRERARLQTFPDDFIFLGSKESVRKQIGMAVPVEGARIIFEAILKTFARIDYDIQKPTIGYFSSVAKHFPADHCVLKKSTKQPHNLQLSLPFMTSSDLILQKICETLCVSEKDAKTIIEKAEAGKEISETFTAEQWLETRFLPNCIFIDEEGYTKMCVDALKILNNTAATDYGATRQRDLGQLWADMTRGYLGEYAFQEFMRQKWHMESNLDHEQGDIQRFLPTDIHLIKEKNQDYRVPNLKISIKTSKWNGIWLDIPGDQFRHSQVHVFVKVGTGRDHLFAFFKNISVFKDKVLKRGEEIGALTPEESQSLFDNLPSFTPIPAYICGFVCSAQDYRSLSYGGKKGRKNYTINSWCGPIEPGDLDIIKERENISGKIQFEGIGSFSHDKGYLFNTGSLMWRADEWEQIRRQL